MAGGGSLTRSKSSVQAVSQGHACGRCSDTRRAEVATRAEPQFAKATTATIRRKLVTVPARVATSARRITPHLPQAWPWEIAWTALFDRVSDPPPVLAA